MISLFEPRSTNRFEALSHASDLWRMAVILPIAVIVNLLIVNVQIVTTITSAATSTPEWLQKFRNSRRHFPYRPSA